MDEKRTTGRFCPTAGHSTINLMRDIAGTLAILALAVLLV